MTDLIGFVIGLTIGLITGPPLFVVLCGDWFVRYRLDVIDEDLL